MFLSHFDVLFDLSQNRHLNMELLVLYTKSKQKTVNDIIYASALQ